MPDDLDMAADQYLYIDAMLHSFRYTLPVGSPGECDECGEYSPRLLGGRCAVCRDGGKR